MQSSGRGPAATAAAIQSPESRSKRLREHVDAITKPTVPLAMCDPRFDGTCGSAGTDVPTGASAPPSGRGPDVMQAFAAGGAAGARPVAPAPARAALPAAGANGLGCAGSAGSLAGMGVFGVGPKGSSAAAGAGANASAGAAGAQLAPAPGGQGVVGALAPPPASDQNLYSKWAMMLQQQLEQAYLERSRVLQLAIKLQVENLHLKEALYSENSQRFMQLVQLGTIAAGPLIDGSGMELPAPPMLPLGPSMQPPPQPQKAQQPPLQPLRKPQLPLPADGAAALSGRGGALGPAGGGFSSSGAEGCGIPLMRVMSAGGTVATASALGAPTPIAPHPPAPRVRVSGSLPSAPGASAAADAASAAAAAAAAATSASAEAANREMMGLFMSEGGLHSGGPNDELDLSTENLQILAKYFDQGEPGTGGADAPRGGGGGEADGAQGNDDSGGNLDEINFDF